MQEEAIKVITQKQSKKFKQSTQIYKLCRQINDRSTIKAEQKAATGGNAKTNNERLFYRILSVYMYRIMCKQICRCQITFQQYCWLLHLVICFICFISAIFFRQQDGLGGWGCGLKWSFFQIFDLKYEGSIKLFLSFYNTHNFINNPNQTKMWNLISSNRILDMRAKQASHHRHLQALRKMKPTMHIKSPEQYNFLQYKAKTIQKNKQRNEEIQTHNSMLVKKMITMPSYVQAVGNVYFKNSLQEGMVKKRERAIDSENQKIVRRLQSANSKYSQRVMSKSVKSYYKAKTYMASSKMDQFYDFESLGHKKSLQMMDPNVQIKRTRPFSAKK